MSAVRYGLIGLALLGLAGCGHISSSGTQVAPDRKTQLQLGKTTEAEAITLLGPPDSRSNTAAGDSALSYLFRPAWWIYNPNGMPPAEHLLLKFHQGVLVDKCSEKGQMAGTGSLSSTGCK